MTTCPRAAARDGANRAHRRGRVDAVCAGSSSDLRTHFFGIHMSIRDRWNSGLSG